MYPIEQGSKFPLDAPILLRHTWGCMLKVDPQPFLFAGSLEDLIFLCIVAVEELYLQIKFFFKFLTKPNIVSTQLDFSFRKKLKM